MQKEYYTSDVLLNRGDIDEVGDGNYPSKSQNTPGNLVYELQSDLRELGYLLAAPDGYFGEGTERAVRQFQEDHQLEKDGLVGENTKAAIERAIAQKERKDPGLTYEYLRDQITSLGYPFDDQPRFLNLIGIRGFWHGEVVANTFNVYKTPYLLSGRKPTRKASMLNSLTPVATPGDLQSRRRKAWRILWRDSIFFVAAGTETNTAHFASHHQCG